MVECIFMGTKKHGCQINNKEETLTYYQYLSLYDKLKKREPNITLQYAQIDSIKVCYGLVTSVRVDSAQITLEVTTIDNVVYDIPLTYYNTKHDDLKTAIQLLQSASINIIDMHNILEEALKSELDLISFIKSIDKSIQSKRKNI